MPSNLNLLLSLLLFICIISQCNCASSRRTNIACYDCNSRNYSDSACHDPVHPAGIKLKEHCKVPKKNHVGLFPALYCIKLIGKSRKTSEEIVVRTCALESMDNSCGVFKYEDELFEGCILTCTYDGCNGAIGSIVTTMGSLLSTKIIIGIQLITATVINSYMLA